MTLMWMCLGGYALGSIPFALLFTRGLVDIRTQGSGNIGATNVLRTAGKSRAAITLLCDIAKGALPVWLALHIFGMTDIEAAVVGTAAIIGHILPVWLKGHGGKALATTLGVYLAMNYVMALGTVVVWLSVVRLSKISSLGALASMTAAPIIGWAIGMDTYLVFWLIGVWAALMMTHRENIQRLLKGEEKPVRASEKNKRKKK